MFAIAFVTSACTKTPIAPVEELQVNKLPSFDFYYVASGDTLYSIAFLENRDYKDLAKWNNIEPPYDLKRGQKIYINKPENFYEKGSIQKQQQPVFVPSVPETPNDVVAAPANNGATNSGKMIFDNTWIWPVRDGYQEHKKSTQNNGLDIIGTPSSAVLASAPGTVVYAGNGLKGYGNMIIIKHNDHYLSAYAHNESLLVNEEEKVAQGQQIARLGSTDSAVVKLHFEIRKDGEPVQPLTLLKAR